MNKKRKPWVEEYARTPGQKRTMFAKNAASVAQQRKEKAEREAEAEEWIKEVRARKTNQQKESA